MKRDYAATLIRDIADRLDDETAKCFLVFVAAFLFDPNPAALRAALDALVPIGSIRQEALSRDV